MKKEIFRIAGIGTSFALFLIALFWADHAQDQTIRPAQSFGIFGVVAHDSVATSYHPILEGCYSSAAAPSDVSADGDSVRGWCLRNGARATVLTAAGALIGGDATNGLDVDVTRLPALATGTNTIGNVGFAPATSGGLSSCVVQSAASTNATNCKGSAGQLYSIQVINTTSTLYYLRLYNSSGSPTCSSATGFIRSIPIPHASGNGGGVVIPQDIGETFGTGIAFCFTGGGSSTDNTNAATGNYITLLYK